MSAVASLFEFTGPDLVVILGIALLLLTANKLSELARELGDAIREMTSDENEILNRNLIALVSAAILLVSFVSSAG